MIVCNGMAFSICLRAAINARRGPLWLPEGHYLGHTTTSNP